MIYYLRQVIEKPKRPRDANLLAKIVVEIATGEEKEHNLDTSAQRKGGLKGGVRRAISLKPEQREKIARAAAIARWNKG